MRVKPWLEISALAFAACTTAPAPSPQRFHQSSGRDAGKLLDSGPTADSSLTVLAAGSPSLHIGDPCDPARDGWHPEPLPAPENDGGQIVFVPAPPGYLTMPPLGVAWCLKSQAWPDGYVTARCQVDSDCPDAARCNISFPAAGGSCVVPCASSSECAAPSSCAPSFPGGVPYCQVRGGVAGSGERDAGATADCSFCGTRLTCCKGTCMDLGTDQYNCGVCGRVCGGATPFCNYGACVAIPCRASCDAGECCGAQCCGNGETCCLAGGPMGPMPSCIALAAGQSCPHACYDCMCASPDTLIATPPGERRIVDLGVGELVYSEDHGAVVPVPVRQVSRTFVNAPHQVVHVTLANGRTLDVSPAHPLAHGGTFADIAAGGTLDAISVLDARLVAYPYAFTYDILPASDTGTYFAAGVQIGSTLEPSWRQAR